MFTQHPLPVLDWQGMLRKGSVLYFQLCGMCAYCCKPLTTRAYFSASA
jgi:hypothetical protein